MYRGLFYTSRLKTVYKQGKIWWVGESDAVEQTAHGWFWRLYLRLGLWLNSERIDKEIILLQHAQQMHGRPLTLSQPFHILTRLQDDRLPIVDLRHFLVWVGGDDRECVFPLPRLRILPRSSDASHAENVSASR
jgi:hypothetical protein